LLLHPSSTLFPYTTLFRSFTPLRLLQIQAERLLVAALCKIVEAHLGGVQARHRSTSPHGIRCVRRLYLYRLGAEKRELIAAIGSDRKSTRLNSSHVKISYA